MPWKTNWKCEEEDGKVSCSLKYKVKDWAIGRATPERYHGLGVKESLDKLNESLPSGEISVDVDSKEIRITGMYPSDVEKVQKKVLGNKGLKSVKASRGARSQSAVDPDQTMICHKELSKDGKSLNVEKASDASPYDHLPNLKPTVVVMHTEKLMEEWAGKMDGFLGIPRDEIGQIGGGRKDHCFVTLSTIQSLSKKDINDAVKGKINLLISDEVHHSSADEWKKAVCDLNVVKREKFKNEDDELVEIPTGFLPPNERVKTLGLSATPTPFGLERTKILEDCIGPTLINIKDSDIINQGYILPVKMIRESIEPEKQTQFITDIARIMSSDYTSMINEKRTSAKEDHGEEYDIVGFEEAFQSAVGGTQFAASAYDENKIKYAIERIASNPDQNFLVYSPRVIPLYAVTTLLRDLHIDTNVVPFIGKGSQDIKQYKGVKRQIEQIQEELEGNEKEIEELEAKKKIKGEKFDIKEENALNNLKIQSKFLEEIAKVGIEQSIRKVKDINETWIKTGIYPPRLIDEVFWIPSMFSKGNPTEAIKSMLRAMHNDLEMPMDQFKKVRMTGKMQADDLRPPIILPTVLWVHVGKGWKERVFAWYPRTEYKPERLLKAGKPVNQAPDPWDGNERFNWGTSSSIARWRTLKLFNEYITEIKNLKVAGSAIKHDISKEDFDDTNIRGNFAKGVSRVLPLSTAGQEGVDIPNANNLVVLSIFTKPKDPIQLTGRIKRIADGKKPGDALFLNIKGTSDDIYFRNLMKGLLLDVFETEHGEEFREDLQKEITK